MTKKSILFVSAIVLITLSGCSTSSNQGKKADTDPNFNANQSATNVALSTTSSSISSTSFTPSRTETNRKNYVQPSQLFHPGEFTYDQVGTRQQLLKMRTKHHKIQSGPLSYTITRVRVIKNHAVNQPALNYAEQQFNAKPLARTYYTVQLSFLVQNHSSQDLVLGGVKQLKLSNGVTLAPNQQLSDRSAGRIIRSHKSLTTSALGLLGSQTNPKITSATIRFNPAFHHQRASTPKSNLLKLKIQ
ncbi:hypothetical protein [Levilactobacillus bambusae]|uniref:DUF4352 domain-containing protein n=1 Tax=Levilactobacillus bambusae TaxID=2024736 RepID=A0A2V1N0Z9_9LACO|nr:hypothetical protein [Levilactobacillus bambusae]PWG00693.1 hypothetical protein DCM90_00520 [Levilactobacillus bambusae]